MGLASYIFLGVGGIVLIGLAILALATIFWAFGVFIFVPWIDTLENWRKARVRRREPRPAMTGRRSTFKKAK